MQGTCHHAYEVHDALKGVLHCRDADWGERACLAPGLSSPPPSSPSSTGGSFLLHVPTAVWAEGRGDALSWAYSAARAGGRAWGAGCSCARPPLDGTFSPTQGRVGRRTPRRWAARGLSHYFFQTGAGCLGGNVCGRAAGPWSKSPVGLHQLEA